MRIEEEEYSRGQREKQVDTLQEKCGLRLHIPPNQVTFHLADNPDATEAPGGDRPDPSQRAAGVGRAQGRGEHPAGAEEQTPGTREEGQHQQCPHHHHQQHQHYVSELSGGAHHPAARGRCPWRVSRCVPSCDMQKVSCRSLVVSS